MNIRKENAKRTHDLFYLGTSKTEAPKESFIKIGDLIDDYKKRIQKELIIADMGCAVGALPAYLSKRFNQDKIIGYEYLEVLVNAAKANFPNITFYQASVLNEDAIAESSLDVLTMNGVASLFDDVEPIIKNVSRWIKTNGKLYMHQMFNPYEVDVYITYRDSKKYGINQFETGWNIISQKSFSNLLIKYGGKNIKFHEFNISVDLEKKLDDPIRSWTEKLFDGRRQIVNALCIKQPQYILEVDF